MTKFLFKSNSQSDLSKNIINKLEMLLVEQRHQRSDLALLTREQNKLINSLNLQKQVDEYFDEDKENIPEVEETSS